MPETVTELTQEILGKTWKSPDAARMWLQRRGTRAEALGVTIRPTGDGNLVCLQPIDRDAAPLASSSSVEPAPGAAVASVSSGPLPNVPAYSEADAAVDRDADHAVQPVETPAAANPAEAFEKYATEVDDLLQAQNEEAVSDDDLRPMWEFLLSAEDAVARIIQRRSAALENEIEPQGVSGGVAPTPVAPTVPAAVAPSVAQPNPNNGAERQQAAEESGTFKGAPAPALGQRFLRLEDPMDDGPARLWAPQLAKRLNVAILVCDAHTGAALDRYSPTAPRKMNAPAVPRANGDRSRGDQLPKVMALLDRPGGCDGAEVRDALGWENVPGPYFFRGWAAKAGRELKSAKGDDGVWRFELGGEAA